MTKVFKTLGIVARQRGSEPTKICVTSFMTGPYFSNGAEVSTCRTKCDTGKIQSNFE